MTDDKRAAAYPDSDRAPMVDDNVQNPGNCESTVIKTPRASLDRDDVDENYTSGNLINKKYFDQASSILYMRGIPINDVMRILQNRFPQSLKEHNAWKAGSKEMVRVYPNISRFVAYQICAHNDILEAEITRQELAELQEWCIDWEM